MKTDVKRREKRGEKTEENIKREETRLKTTRKTKDGTKGQRKNGGNTTAEKKQTEWMEEKRIEGQSRGALYKR